MACYECGGSGYHIVTDSELREFLKPYDKVECQNCNVWYHKQLQKIDTMLNNKRVIDYLNGTK